MYRLNEMDIKDVILLGAGASKSEDAPLQKELLKEIYKRCWDSSGLGNNIKKYRRERLKTYFKEFWGTKLKKPSHSREFPRFEDCLGLLDVASFYEESFRNYSEKDIRKLRIDLIKLMADVLDEKIKKSGFHRSKRHHKALVERLHDEERLKNTAFISLNYDIIIDNELTKKQEEYSLDLNYGLEFRNYDREDGWHRPRDEWVLLLKPHGSLNWLFCPTCAHMELTPKSEGKALEAFDGSTLCNDCGTPMQPVIVPPTPFKEVSHPYLRKVSILTEKVLQEIETVFICGYSLPEVDMHMRYLLKKAELYKGKTPKVYIINDHKNKTDEKKEDEKKRFNRFFKDKNRVEYTDLSFQTFSEEGLNSL